MVRRKKMFFTGVVIVIVALILVVGVVWAASLGIDTLNLGVQNLTADSGTTKASSSFADASILGGERDVEVTWFSGTGVVNSTVNQAVVNQLDFDQGSGTTGEVSVIWDGVDNSATIVPDGLCTPTCVDLTGGGGTDGFHIEVTFDDIPDQITMRIYNGSISSYKEFTVNMPADIPPGSHVDFFMPFSLFSDLGPGPYPLFNSVGVVKFLINGSTAPSGGTTVNMVEADDYRDYGDAPSTYGAPSHMPLGLRLGINVDIEAAPLYSAGADGDNSDQGPPNDEDGVARTAGVQWRAGLPGEGNGGSVDLTVSGCMNAPCFVSGWVDWNQDGDFADTGEQVFSDSPILSNGLTTVTFAIPSGVDAPAFNTDYYSRFRICPTSGVCNDALAVDVLNGEVEDYIWSFGPNVISLTSLDARSNPVNAVAISLAVGIFFGGFALIMIYRRKKAANL